MAQIWSIKVRDHANCGRELLFDEVHTNSSMRLINVCSVVGMIFMDAICLDCYAWSMFLLV